MSDSQPRELRGIEWFGPTRPVRAAGARRALVQGALALAVAALLAAAGHRAAGAVVGAIAAALTGASLASVRFRDALAAGTAGLGRAIGTALSWIVLAPLYLAVFPLLRGWARLDGRDLLQLRSSSRPTFWVDADAPARKVRHAAAMFATERFTRRRRPLAAALALGAVLLLAAEGVLRLFGLGQPVLYVPDAQAGYVPAPNQRVRAYGGRVETNAFGMRSPQFAVEKPPGTFRVLLLGDSTLWGGLYMDQEDLYSRRLERALREEAGGRDVEVLAMGVNAWGPFHELGWVEKHGTFGADLAIVCLPIGDIYRPLYGLSRVPFATPHRPPALALEEALTFAIWSVRERQLGPTPAADLAWHGEQGVRAYAELTRSLRRRGAEVMFEVLPTRAAAFGPAPEGEAYDVERLRRALHDGGATHLDYPAGFLARRADEGGALYHDAWHLGPAGHAVYARHLRDEIVGRSPAWATWRAARGVASSAEARP